MQPSPPSSPSILRSPIAFARKLASWIAPLAALALTLATGPGCVSPPPLAEATASTHSFATTAQPASFPLGPGDLLHLTVVGQPDIAPAGVPLRLDPEGVLVLPYCGPLELAGLTTTEASALIRGALNEYLVEPEVGLSVAEFAARRAYVLGEVERPGAYVLDRPLTGLQVLALAGSVQRGGDRKNVALLRASGNDLEVHFFNAATPDAASLVRVEPDDVIFVRLSRGGTFSEQVVPVLQAAAPIFSALTNLLIVSDALSDD